MPRDDWAKAKAADVARRQKSKNASRGKQAMSRKKFVTMRTVENARLQSWGAILWFGKHKGTRLRDCPKSYLEFLTSIEPTSPRIRVLVSFLKAELP